MILFLTQATSPFPILMGQRRHTRRGKKNRVYLKSNRTAERIVHQVGGAWTREAKRRLSLSDSFWIKYPYDNDTAFGDITPYKNPFSLMVVAKGVANSSSVPELVVGGSQPKQWCKGRDGVTYMSKSESGGQIHAEMLAVKLAHIIGLKCMNSFILTENGRTYAKIIRLTSSIQVWDKYI